MKLNVKPVVIEKAFFRDSVKCWNDIGPQLRDAVSLSVFKTNIIKLIRPPKRSIFDIHDVKGVRKLYQLRVGLSPPKCHMMKHNFRDCLSDICDCLNDAETLEHYFLHCNNYIEARRTLMLLLTPILLSNDLLHLNKSEMVNLLLYGHTELSPDINKLILKASLKFINETRRI